LIIQNNEDIVRELNIPKSDGTLEILVSNLPAGHHERISLFSAGLDLRILRSPFGVQSRSETEEKAKKE
jgi:hypothetical protein